MFNKGEDEGLLLENDDVQELTDTEETDKIVKKEKIIHSCEFCEKTFSNRAALNKHTSKNHPSSKEMDDSVVLDDPDEDLLQENDDIIEIGEDMAENGSPNKSFDIVDIEEIKMVQNSGEKRSINKEEDTPDNKRIKSTSEPQPQSKASNEEPIDYEFVVSNSDYFTKNPKQITTKCNLGLHSKNIFTLIDPILPTGWKMREHKKPDSTLEKHYLAPDGRVLKTRIAALEYLRVIAKYSKEKTTTKIAKKSDVERPVEVIKSFTPKQNSVTPVTYSNVTSVRRRRQKNKKDPNAPKQPMGAYFLFTVEERPKVKAENPDMSITEIARELGQRWGQLEESIKKSFQESAEEARRKYDQDMAEYRKTDSASLFNSQKQVTYSRRSSDSTGQMKPERRSGVGQECPECHKVVGALQRHMEDIHSPPGNFPCPGCQKVFSSRNKQSSHTSRHCNPSRSKM